MSQPDSLFVRVRATGRLWNTLLIVLDALVVLLATVVAFEVRFEFAIPMQYAQWIPRLLLICVLTYGLLFAIFDQYRLVLRYVGLDTLIRLLSAVTIGFMLISGLNFAIGLAEGLRPVPVGVLFIQAALVFLGASAARLSARVLRHVQARRNPTGRRVLIVGAGSSGSLLLREIHGRPDLELHVVGLLDDNPSLRYRLLDGIPVLGATEQLHEIVESMNVQEILVAMPSAPQETIRRLLNAAADAGIQTRVIPPLVIAKGSVSLRDLRNVDVEDLLGREPTRIDTGQVRSTVESKVVAVTGAAGSIGSELCRQIVQLDPAKLLLIEVDETRLYELYLELEASSPGLAVMCVCDIRDADRLDDVFALHRPAVVLHAAAYKHVPLMELAPAEAIKTNVLGTRQVIEACQRHGAERFVLISTDKAVAPANIMGLTKSLAEKIMLEATHQSGLCAVAVRFGNVLASRGSVVPIFEEQLRRGGPLTVTHPDVTRYFMTIPEAARLVLQAQAIGEPGDIFVLEMGEPVRIVDLAHKMIALSGVPADIDFVGLRPGEKLHETLTTDEEGLLPTEREKILRVDRVEVLAPGFSADVDGLIAAAIDGDEGRVREGITRLAPEFSSAGGTAAHAVISADAAIETGTVR